MFDYFRNCSSNAHYDCVKIARPKVYIIFFQFDDLNLHSRSQLRLKHDNSFTCTIIVIYRTLESMTYMLLLVPMTLTLIQGHSSLAYK